MSSRASLPAAPRHLSRRSKELWRSVLEDYELEIHHRELLRLALEALDRCEEARKAIAKDGPFVPTRSGRPAAHPALAVERDSRLAAARLLRELDLEGEPLPDPRPRRRS